MFDFVQRIRAAFRYMNRDVTNLENLSDRELHSLEADFRRALVEAELKRKVARLGMAKTQEELEWRKSGIPKRGTEYWEHLSNKETEAIAEACGVDLGDVAEIALRLSKEI